jgi:hypothetical protein
MVVVQAAQAKTQTLDERSVVVVAVAQADIPVPAVTVVTTARWQLPARVVVAPAETVIAPGVVQAAVV